jgi:hypothetical protein
MDIIIDYIRNFLGYFSPDPNILFGTGPGGSPGTGPDLLIYSGRKLVSSDIFLGNSIWALDAYRYLFSNFFT